MDSDVLAKDIVVPYNELRWFALVLQILRRETDGTEREKAATLAYAGRAFNDDMLVYTTTSAQHYVVTDHRIGTDVHVLSQ
jgi:hypothetical protein